MCGILFSTRTGIDRDDFVSALKMMAHRGPDAAGCYLQSGIAQLGHNRLSILDLNPRSNQPFAARDGRYVIVFNGEIYNYLELAREHGIELRTSSDTELLVELYSRYGARMLPWLYGMFSFVIYDQVSGAVFVARDRLGVKPLYIFEDEEGVIISSEISAIKRLLPRVTLDEFAVRQYRVLRGFFNGRTIYREIRMFPAGHYRLEKRTSCYWSLPRGEQIAPEDGEIEALLRSAVDYRCISDVPVGSLLSGGLDSSIVAALSNLTHTWVVGLGAENEFSWAEKVARHIGSEHQPVIVEPEEFLASARMMIATRGEPLAVPNEVLLYEMSRRIKRKNTVVLSGEGADELFAGYDRIFRWADAAKQWDVREFARQYCYGSSDDMEVVEDAVGPFMDRGSALAITSAFFQIAHLHGLLRRLDNSTMLCSVEGRVPFVDHRLVERLAGVPLSYKMPNGEVKAPLKRIFGHLLPRSVVERPKVGFPVNLEGLLPEDTPGARPMDRWFNFNLSELGLEAMTCNSTIV